MTPCNLSPNYSNLASSNSPLSFIDIRNAFSKVELSIFTAIASFDFYEGRAGFTVSLAASVRDVFASYVESRTSEEQL